MAPLRTVIGKAFGTVLMGDDAPSAPIHMPLIKSLVPLIVNPFRFTTTGPGKVAGMDITAPGVVQVKLPVNT